MLWPPGSSRLLATSLILRRSRLREDTAAAVVFVFMLALGVAIVSRVEGYTVDLNSFLFGDVLGVERGEVVTTAVLTAAVLLAWSPCSIGPSCCCRSTASAPPRSGSRSTRCTW